MARLRPRLRHAAGAAGRRLFAGLAQTTFKIRNTLLRHKPLRVRVGGANFLLLPEGLAAEGVWKKVRPQRQQLQQLLRVLRPGMVVVDVGADVGVFSLAVACQEKTCRVFACEPDEQKFQWLLRNLALNGADTVIATQALTTLPEFLARHGLPKVDLLRVDADGAELPVMQGLKELFLEEYAPLILCRAESRLTWKHGYHPVETMWFLRDCGYSLLALSGAGSLGLRAPGQDYDAVMVAVKPQHPCYSLLKTSAP